jgi:hypothetical protein
VIVVVEVTSTKEVVVGRSIVVTVVLASDGYSVDVTVVKLVIVLNFVAALRVVRGPWTVVVMVLVL